MTTRLKKTRKMREEVQMRNGRIGKHRNHLGRRV